ncbi:MAG TPA: hypothetical protein VGI30_13175 [Caulobacteraceae bacterium]|jgi:hypothetical protein
MKKLITAGMAALTLAVTGLAAAPASARDWGGYRGHGDDAGYAIAGGIVGLALGAMMASHHDHYDRDHYRYSYDGYGYNGPYAYSQPYGYEAPYGYGD